jgi:hypothetical protein
MPRFWKKRTFTALGKANPENIEEIPLLNLPEKRKIYKTTTVEVEKSYSYRTYLSYRSPSITHAT